ncbi:MAG: hypothetical protein JO079_00150, partial [Frankiaceae bacterium]|nr:hypothetical protein [Frankiaceae bacterium]MBV9369596.1 hypothetical protein [Frankiales bacterium]
LFVAVLVGGTIQLIPLSFMPGRALARWHRGVWSALFGVTLFTLVAAMLNPGQSNVHPGRSSIVTAILLLVGFGGGSVLFAAYWARKPARHAAGEEAAVTAVEEAPAVVVLPAEAPAAADVPVQRRLRKTAAAPRKSPP